MSRINRQSRRVTKQEALSQQKERLAYKQQGKGLYLYRNKHKEATLELAKPLKDGTKTVQPGAEFEGDDYYMSMIKAGDVIFVREIISPQEEANMQQVNEQKLILDQPATVTADGTVEHVVLGDGTNLPLHEGQPVQQPGQKKDVLLTEEPVDGLEIILD